MKFQARRGRRQVLGRSCVVVGAWTWNRNRSKGGKLRDTLGRAWGRRGTPQKKRPFGVPDNYSVGHLTLRTAQRRRDRFNGGGPSSSEPL